MLDFTIFVTAASLLLAQGVAMRVVMEVSSHSLVLKRVHGCPFKVAVFMPMAISFLSAGVTWRLIYEENPDLGLANASARAIAATFRSPGAYPGAMMPSETTPFRKLAVAASTVSERATKSPNEHFGSAPRARTYASAAGVSSRP